MPSLDDLPQELSDVILDHLDVISLAAMVQLNKTMRAVASPSLYRSVKILVHDGFPVVGPIDSFLQTLLETPTHAAHVKEFKVQARPVTRSYASDRRSIPAPEPWADALRRKTTDMLDRAQLRDATDWEMAICDEQNTCAQLAFIVARLHNLQNLTVETSLTLSDGDWFSDMLEHSFSHTVTREHWTRFDRLTHVQLGKGDEIMMNHLTRRVISLALALPKLTNLCLWRGVDLKPHDVSGQVMTAGQLTTLQLEDTTIHPGVLEKILQENLGLTRLSCNYYLPSFDTPLQLDGLQRALCHARNSLIHLSMRYIPYVADDAPLEIESLTDVLSETLGSFHAFTQLTNLDISLFMLYGQDDHLSSLPPLGHLLPPTLTRLTLSDDLWGFRSFDRWDASFFLANMSKFLSEEKREEWWRRSTPGLRAVVYDFRRNLYMMGGWGDEQIRELGSMCEAQGLKCSILIDDDDEV
ncbi:hypothetical protein NX059_010472 [Plenodomus lindquistii]|nr:hypothetical protein NX059_010472 [Plenodomus lindquistii]